MISTRKHPRDAATRYDRGREHCLAPSFPIFSRALWNLLAYVTLLSVTTVACNWAVILPAASPTSTIPAPVSPNIASPTGTAPALISTATPSPTSTAVTPVPSPTGTLVPTGLFAVYYLEPFDLYYPDETPENVFDSLSMGATPGEFEPATFAIKAANSDLDEVKIEASDLEGKGDVISKDNIDIRVVKVWKQKDAPDLRYVETILPGHPEIESKIDYDERAFEIPDILLEDEIYFDHEVVGHAWSLDNLPSIPHVGYARTNIPANTLKQFWITVKVPEDTQPGVYEGSVSIFVDSNREADLKLNLTVLPFTLVESDRNLFVAMDYDYSMPLLFAEAVKDIHDHGLNSIQLPRINLRDDKELNAVCDLLAQYKLDKHVVIHNYPRTKSEVEKVLNKGIELYFYGIDEPWPKPPKHPYPCNLALQVELSRLIHEMGGKVVTQIMKEYVDELSNCNSQLYHDLGTFDPAICTPLQGRQPKNFDFGSICEPLDMSFDQIFFKNWTKYLDLEIHNYIKKIQQDPHSKDSYPENYYYNAGYVLYPFENRLLYGFFLFNSHLDGVRAWTYQRPFANPYDDFDGILRGVQVGDVNLVYPSQESLVPTYGWEAIREGIDDLRYAETAASILEELESFEPEQASQLRQRLNEILAPFVALTYDDNGNNPWKKCDNAITVDDKTRGALRPPTSTECGNSKRIDELYHEKDLRIAREQIIDLILEAAY